MVGPPSKPNAPIVIVNMTDRDVVERVARILGGRQVSRIDRNTAVWKPSYTARISGYAATQLMLRLRPHMGQRRRQQIDRAVASYSSTAVTKADLTEEMILDIAERIDRGDRIKDIASTLGLSYRTIWRIARGETWRWLIDRKKQSGKTRDDTAPVT